MRCAIINLILNSFIVIFLLYIYSIHCNVTLKKKLSQLEIILLLFFVLPLSSICILFHFCFFLITLLYILKGTKLTFVFRTKTLLSLTSQTLSNLPTHAGTAAQGQSHGNVPELLSGPTRRFLRPQHHKCRVGSLLNLLPTRSH